MLCADPNQRIGIDEALAHPYFEGDALRINLEEEDEEEDGAESLDIPDEQSIESCMQDFRAQRADGVYKTFISQNSSPSDNILSCLTRGRVLTSTEDENLLVKTFSVGASTAGSHSTIGSNVSPFSCSNKRASTESSKNNSFVGPFSATILNSWLMFYIHMESFSYSILFYITTLPFI